jgi:plasmid stability protein
MVTETKDSTQSCYLRLPSDMHKALRVLCAVNKRSINIEVQEALLVHLRKNKDRIEAAGNAAIP